MNIAVAGYGVEGRANYDYYISHGHTVTIVDERADVPDLPDGAITKLGEGVFNHLSDYDLVVRTPGLPPRRLASASRIWSATNEFLAQCPAPIIGVTGTKGKGTTSSLIAAILRASGRTVHLVGNIGVPALRALPTISEDDIVVYELSSFQLWDVERSPSVAVLLMIEPDHLEVHTDMNEYVMAKANITRYQSDNDTLVYKVDNDYVTQARAVGQAMKIPFQSEDAAHVKDGHFWYGEQRLCSVEALKLPGVHNQDNACAAISASWRWVTDANTIATGLTSFEGLPHRLKFIREHDGVRYYDDSIATTPGSAIAALKAFDEPKVIILGGSSKGASFGELADEVAHSETRAAILIGEEADRLEEALQSAGFNSSHNLGRSVTMDGIVSTAQRLSRQGDIVILSPSCASFDMFKSYSDRGDQFATAVNAL